MRGAEGNGGPKERGPELVVVGHVGTSIVHVGADSRTSAGGSGYAVAASAGSLIGDRAGLVAAVGTDFDLAPLRSRRVDLDGVTELPGPSAKLRIREFDDGTHSFSAELGVAAAVRTGTFPARYLDADYIHLGTAPPDQQLTWLEYLHERGCRAHISADMFEHYVATYPTTSREVCDSVDLIFMNQVEYDGLYGDAQLPVPKDRSSSSADPSARGSSWTVIRKRWRPPSHNWWTRRAAARCWPASSSRCGRTGCRSAWRCGTRSAPRPAAWRTTASPART